MASLVFVLLAGCGDGTPERVEDGAAVEASPQPEIVLDVVYGHKHGMALTYDVYRPVEANGAGVVFMNSGGWVSPVVSPHVLDRDGARLVDRSDTDGRVPTHTLLVDRGFTVFNVRHGSAPKFVLPEVVDDVRRAIRHIRATAGEHGVDPERLGVWGGSAGGHLSLLLGTGPEVEPLAAREDGVVTAAPVAAVVAYYPPTDLRAEELSATAEARARERDRDVVEAFPALDFPRELDGAMSPAAFVSPGDPPTLLVHGDADDLVPLSQSELMLAALEASGVPAELVVLEGAGHGFEGADAARAQEALLAWFRRHLVERAAPVG